MWGSRGGERGRSRGRGRGTWVALYDLAMIDNLFNTYAELDVHDTMCPTGLLSLIHDLHDRENTEAKLLSLAWKVQAARKDYFTREEWRRGLRAMRADTMEKLSTALGELVSEATNPDNLESFYRYAFWYYLTENMGTQLGIQTACRLLRIILGNMYPDVVQEFIEYLREHQYACASLNSEQWLQFLRFCREVQYPSLENFEDNPHWASIFYHFSFWIRCRQLPWLKI